MTQKESLNKDNLYKESLNKDNLYKDNLNTESLNTESLNTEIEQNKLIILYVLQRLRASINSISFSRIFLEKRLMNYYIMQHCLNDLSEVGFIERTGNEINVSYNISETGKQYLSYFSSKIPLVMRESIKNAIVEIKENIKRESEIITEYHELEDGGWLATCGVYENNCTILEVKVLTGNRIEAHNICSNWKQNINILYPSVLSLLLSKKPFSDN